jgi:two-component system sensor histidine kinase KdpD
MLHDEALRMSALVSNLLDMARIESGEVRFNLQWQTLEEVVGTALRASGPALKDHVVTAELARDLPLVRFDAVLIERVLILSAANTPPGSLSDPAVPWAWIKVIVSDNGRAARGLEQELLEIRAWQRESAGRASDLAWHLPRDCRPRRQTSACRRRRRRVRLSLPLGTPPACPTSMQK